VISVVIPLYNDEENIHQCLASLSVELLAEDEVIVVDNGSTDHSVSIVSQFQEMNVKLLTLEVGNVSAVRNFGAQHAKGDILAFIDSDCLVQSGWRSASLRKLHGSDESIVATGSKCFVPKDVPWFTRTWFAQRRPDGDVIYINSGNFIIKKSVFQSIKGFNDTLVTGEDSEICLRLRQAGYRVVEDAAIAVVHLGNPKTLTAFFQQQKWHALGMFGTVGWTRLDKPFLMTIAFGVIIFFAFVWVLMTGLSTPKIITSIFLVSLVPLLSSLYRTWTTKKWSNIPQLFILYIIYFVARLNVLLALTIGWANLNKKRIK
jgi:glycosyltransferase involved in cell wall biosynthesis